MVEVKHLCASYSDQEILHDISLSFLPGKVTVLAGPNGCGKSTLLRAILGFAEKTGGEITVDGGRMETFSQRELAQKIAYLPQSRPIPNISAYRMVLHGRFPYLGYPRRYRQEDREAVKKALERVGADTLARYVEKFGITQSVSFDGITTAKGNFQIRNFYGTLI